MALRTLISALAIGASLTGPVHAAPAAACSVLSDADASKLLGGPLGEEIRSDKAAEDDNGNDRLTSCGRFPKGYYLENADGPPARGVLVELHALPDAAAAKRFYEGVLRMHEHMAGAPGGTRVTKVEGIGSGGYLKPTVLPGSAVRITTLTFLKGSIVGSAQVWTTTGAADGIARSAAQQIAARLP